MAEQQVETERDENSRPELSIDTELSEESRRQREGTEDIGAFGKRTGESDLIFLQGILPEINGDVMSGRSIEEQSGAVLDRLELMLSNRGVSLENVMKIEIQLTDPDVAEAVDSVYRSRFEDVGFPPRSVVGVCSLPGGADVQLDVVAAEE